jgi:methyl-accepting chemotaxis protein/aerotaxis receptor
MRINEPCTDREVLVPEDEILVSRTDAGGRIQFCNKAFIDVSGFSQAELIGAPHNIVRHPDMPKEAFANLWETIKAGRPWEGLVKNRTKTGDFYWVRANVTPVVEGGQVVGYVSLRSRPSREAVAQANAAYAAIRAGKGHGLALRDGAVVRSGWRSALGSFATSVTGRLAAAGVAALLVVAAVAGIGLVGMQQGTEQMRTVYEDRLVPTAQLGTVLDLMREGREQAALIALDPRGPRAAAAERGPSLRAALTRIDEVWRAYMATYLTPEEATLAERLAGQTAALRRDGLEAALALAGQDAAAELRGHVMGPLDRLFTTASGTIHALIDLQSRVAAQTYAEARADLAWHLTAIAGLVLLAVVMLGGLGWLTVASLRRPLRQLEQHFDAIASGDLRRNIANPAAREFLRAAAFLRAMAARLGYTAQERIESERLAAEQRASMIGTMAETVERESRRAVELVATRTTGMATQATAVSDAVERASANSEAASEAAHQALGNVQAVAAAAEELAASIQEITRQAALAGQVTGRAVSGGKRTEETIRSLSEAVGRIGDVAGLIGTIAAQTNLLALNATIEAARAGDAGKGFAVVAGEVKNLATETARRTEEISRQIAGIQGVTAEAVEAVGAIGSTISEISEVATAIAAAMEEQSAATQEIARNVADSGAAVRDMVQRINNVAGDVSRTGEVAAAVRAGSGEVDASVSELRNVLVKVVRTSLEEADRRMEERYPASEPCRVQAGGRQAEGKLLNVSLHGALVADVQGLGEGMRGSLELPRHPGLRLGFEVRQVTALGTHLRFDDASVNDAWRRALATISGQQYRTKAA